VPGSQFLDYQFLNKHESKMAIDYQSKRITLDVIDYARVQRQDDQEIQKLLQICQTSGIFFLDLQDAQSDVQVYDDMSTVIAAQRKFFARSKTDKMMFADESPSRG
jgi:isopenicillin N synthase-like dioxygenase